MIATLIKYSDIYTEELPDDYVDLIRGISKNELIATISTLNSRLKPMQDSFFDESINTQLNCLRLVFLDEQNSFQNSNCKSFLHKYNQLLQSNKLIFNRATCLYALQKVINVKNFNPVVHRAYTVDDREAILKFLLIVNEKLLSYDNSYEENDHETLKRDFFEYYLFKELPHNQYFQVSNVVNVFYKSWYLFTMLMSDSFFRPHFEKYLTTVFGTSNLILLYKIVLYSVFASYDRKLKSYYINVENTNENKDAIMVLDSLSNRIILNALNEGDLSFLEFLDIKKSPLYKDGTNANDILYTILDITLFVEKFNSLFINDFWFDYLKPKNICERKDWGNFIGDKFFEPFIDSILKGCLQNNKRVVYRHTTSLKFKFDKKSEIEYADYYLRQGNTVVLTEAKSSYLSSVNGYKTVNTKEDYKNLDLKRFYKDFGLDQIVKKVLKLFGSFKNLTDDKRINGYKKIKVYPVIILNDQIFDFSIFNYVFKQRFFELLALENIPIETSERKIYPVTLVLISDLQNIEQSLQDGDENLFNLIRYYQSSTDILKVPYLGDYAPFQSFNDTTSKRVKNKSIANHIKSLKWVDK